MMMNDDACASPPEPGEPVRSTAAPLRWRDGVSYEGPTMVAYRRLTDAECAFLPRYRRCSSDCSRGARYLFSWLEGVRERRPRSHGACDACALDWCQSVGLAPPPDGAGPARAWLAVHYASRPCRGHDPLRIIALGNEATTRAAYQRTVGGSRSGTTILFDPDGRPAATDRPTDAERTAAMYRRVMVEHDRTVRVRVSG